MQVWATWRQRALITLPLRALKSPAIGSKLSGVKSFPACSRAEIWSRHDSISGSVSSSLWLYLSRIIETISSRGSSLYIAIMS